MAQAKPGGASGEQSLLLFRIAGRQFGVELGQVEQILDAQPIAPTPRRPSFVEGILEYRGRFLAVASLRKRLGVASPAPEHPAVLVLRNVGPDQMVALLVDQVLHVLRIPPEGILAPPPRVFGIRADYIRGIGNAEGHPMVWLDVSRMLASDEPIALLI
jgi:purine-binding chemotaxis protein CheW